MRVFQLLCHELLKKKWKLEYSDLQMLLEDTQIGGAH